MKKKLSQTEREELLQILTARFEKNMNRHKGLVWNEIKTRLEMSPGKLWSLNQMEKQAANQSDVTDYDKDTGEYIFYDCHQGKRI
ncbi:DUF4256 domain-containing protein [Parafilimonas sp.]|uniref:DUF4256 domain-containing protein n=1 Tax=Parafilimonas sp. TaxID=1969739 RepID=UPI0039E2F83D